jgi:rod shape-determining protein MreB
LPDQKCIPSGITEVEKRAVRESAEQSNARQVFLVEEPVAAAIGMGIDISKPIGNMIVDIGGGTTEVAVIALNGVVSKESIRIAGDEMDNDIILYFREKYNLLIGERTAEDIKKKVGAAMKNKGTIITVKGRNLVYGIPKTVEISSNEIAESLEETIKSIIIGIKKTLEKTPPELSADILDRGIILTGGGALLNGLDKLIRIETGLPVNVAENPLLTVIKGTGKILENIKLYTDIIV